MREKMFILIMPLLLILISSSGCVQDDGNNSSLTFQNSEISFDYPHNWTTFTDFWPSAFKSSYKYLADEDLNATEIAGVLDPDSETSFEKFSISVMIETTSASGDLEEVFNSTYTRLYQRQTIGNSSTYRQISQRNLTVDGVSAYENVYQIPHGEPYYQFRDIWLKKNGKIYIISCRAFPSNFNDSQSDFNLIINSFHVK